MYNILRFSLVSVGLKCTLKCILMTIWIHLSTLGYKMEQAHNPKVVGSSPTPATKESLTHSVGLFCCMPLIFRNLVLHRNLGEGVPRYKESPIRWLPLPNKWPPFGGFIQLFG